MFKAKQFYMDCLKSGVVRHDYIAKQLNPKFKVSASVVRDALLESGHIIESGNLVRCDGKKIYTYELTGKPLKAKPKAESPNWEDGTPKSRGNAFDWRNFSKGIFNPSELAASEAGRKFGIMSANKKIPSRVSI